MPHRRSSYFQLGTPWIAPTGASVTHLLATFAQVKTIRWKTVEAPTALSLHGAARLLHTDSARRAEIEEWLRRAASMSPTTLFSGLDFCWHFVRTLWVDPPSDQPLREYLLRAGLLWGGGPLDAVPGLLSIPLTKAQRQSIETAYCLFQGRRPDDAKRVPDILLALLDNVLGGFIPVEFALKLLEPFGWADAIQIVRMIYPGISDMHCLEICSLRTVSVRRR